MHASTPRDQLEHRIEDLRATLSALEQRLAHIDESNGVAAVDRRRLAANASSQRPPIAGTPLPIAAG